jgi:hypothetical protein
MRAIHFAAALGVALLAPSVYAQEGNFAGDPGGWGKSRWGMSIDEVRTAFPGELMLQAKTPVVYKAGECYLRIPKTDIAEYPFQVEFITRDGRLSAVVLKPAGFNPGSAAWESTYEHVGRILQTELTFKYGKPWLAHRDEWGKLTASWRFPATAITLMAEGSALTLVYEQIQSGKL